MSKTNVHESDHIELNITIVYGRDHIMKLKYYERPA